MCICVDVDPLACISKRRGFSPEEWLIKYGVMAKCQCSCHKTHLTPTPGDSADASAKNYAAMQKAAIVKEAFEAGWLTHQKYGDDPEARDYFCSVYLEAPSA